MIRSYLNTFAGKPHKGVILFLFALSFLTVNAQIDKRRVIASAGRLAKNLYTGICNCCFSGQAGTAGLSSRISINSSNFQNYIFEAQGGGAGGAGLFQGTGGTGGAGGNGSLIYGSQYQNVGAFVFDPNLNGQGAAVILRW